MTINAGSTHAPMTIGKLIELLKRYPLNAEVRIAHQPQWPFQYAVRGTVANEQLSQDVRQSIDADQHHVVWIIEGRLVAEGADEIWQAAIKHEAS